MTDAEIIARARALYPRVTVSVVSDAYLTVWLPWARQLTGPAFGAMRNDAIAMLLAHRAFRGPLGLTLGVDGEVTPGAVESIGKRSLSASFGRRMSDLAQSVGDASLATTGPGCDWLQIREALPGVVVPPVVVY